VKSFQLFDGHPYEICVDGGIEFFAYRERHLPRGGLSIASIPNQRRGPIEAMRFVPIQVVNKRFIIQFADNQPIVSRQRQSSNIFHLRIRPSA